MEKSSFFNSINGDRKYKAEDFAAYFGSFISNGIFPNPTDNLRVISNENMTVTLKPGKAWINGYFYVNDNDLILPIDVADGVLDRIDRVVIRLDYVNREIRAVVKKGTFASSPIAPTLQRDMDIYELAIADIKINKGAVSILQADIIDTRLDLNLCGVTNSLITVDVGIITEQFSEDFTAWFERIKGQLGEDPAGNLQNQINLLEENKVSNVTFNEHLADYATQTELGHVNLSDFSIWQRLEVITTEQATGNLEITLPTNFENIRIVANELRSVSGMSKLYMALNNDTSANAYMRWATSDSGQVDKIPTGTIKDAIGTTNSITIEILNGIEGERLVGIQVLCTLDPILVIGLWQKGYKANILNLSLDSGIQIAAGSVFEIWGR